MPARGDGTSRAERIARGEGAASTVLLTFLDADGAEWTASASMTTLRRKGASVADVAPIQITERDAESWRLKEFKVVEP